MEQTLQDSFGNLAVKEQGINNYLFRFLRRGLFSQVYPVVFLLVITFFILTLLSIYLGNLILFISCFGLMMSFFGVLGTLFVSRRFFR